MTGKPGFFRSILILMNVGVIVAFLITCFLPFINTAKYWFFAFPGLIFPLILFALVSFIVLWAILKSRWWWISLIALLLGFQQIAAVFAFNISKEFSDTKNPHTLRVMQWNVSNFDEDNNTGEEGTGYRLRILELIKNQNTDVLCIEEFFESYDTKYFKPNISALVNMGFQYYYFIPTVSHENDFKSGIAIFSKYPVIKSGNYSFTKSKISEHLIYTDIKVKDKIFRIFATHLQSVRFDASDYQSLSRIKQAEKPDLNGSKTIVSKLKRGYELRYKQAELVSEKIKESPYPSIICGDFNDVPNSSAYFKIKGNLQDAFLKEGWGIGRTFLFISPTLRIDYILADKIFKVNQFQIIHVPYSDHYPLITDLQY